MNELTVILKARQFVREAGIDSIPVDVERLASAANAVIKVSGDLHDEESGNMFPLAGKNIITVNRNHREERQRFTALHEIAHIVLDLPSQHSGVNIATSELMSYKRRPREEILCDVFAAECLLPFTYFRKAVDDVDVSFDAVKELAAQYKASITSTGSRFAVNCNESCAFVLMESGKIRYVSMSKHLRELKGWINIGIQIPKGSVAYKLSRTDADTQDYDEIPTDVWFNNGVKDFNLLQEEAICLSEWDQYLSLIWFEDIVRPDSQRVYVDAEGDDLLLEELDGVLPWPGKRKRK